MNVVVAVFRSAIDHDSSSVVPHRCCIDGIKGGEVRQPALHHVGRHQSKAHNVFLRRRFLTRIQVQDRGDVLHVELVLTTLWIRPAMGSILLAGNVLDLITYGRSICNMEGHSPALLSQG